MYNLLAMTPLINHLQFDFQLFRIRRFRTLAVTALVHKSDDSKLVAH